MDIFLAKTLGVLLVAAGLFLLLKPMYINLISEKMKDVRWLYATGVVRILLGVILLIAAPRAFMAWLVFVLGLVVVASGIIVFVLKRENVLQLIDFIFNKPDESKRFFGLVPLVLGVIVLFSM